VRKSATTGSAADCFRIERVVSEGIGDGASIFCDVDGDGGDDSLLCGRDCGCEMTKPL